MRTQESSQISYSKILQAVKKLSVEDKEKLYINLKNERLNKNLKKLREITKRTVLSFDEISKEVELVRKSRYDSKKKQQTGN